MCMLLFAFITLSAQATLTDSLRKLQVDLKSFSTALGAPAGRQDYTRLSWWGTYVSSAPYFALHRVGEGAPQALVTSIPYTFYFQLLDTISRLNYGHIAEVFGKQIDFVRGDPIVYVQKVIVTAPATIYCWGDFHGDMYTLCSSLEYLRDKEKVLNDNFVLNKSTYLVFNGDYVDRGWYGVEVHAMLCLLKSQNPNQVFIMRGNHEDITVDEKYGFLKELGKKFPAHQETEFTKMLNTFYRMLPVVLFVGVQHRSMLNYLYFCHGGLEFYDAKDLLLSHKVSDYRVIRKIRSDDDLKQVRQVLGSSKEAQNDLHELLRSMLHELDPFTKWFQHPINTLVRKASSRAEFRNFEEPSWSSLGFMWADFASITGTTVWQKGRGFYFSNPLSDMILAALFDIQKRAKVIAIFRAHQHNDTMPGLIDEEVLGRTVVNPNRNVYKLPYMREHMVFTSVATPAMELPGRGFLKIKLESNDPDKWKLTSIWAPCKLHNPTDCQDWDKVGNITLAAWYNERD